MPQDLEFKKYRKLPVVVEAATLTEKRVIKSREGEIVGYPGDKLMRGVEGEEYPCGKEIFAKTYEPAMSEMLAEAIKTGVTADYGSLTDLRYDFLNPIEFHTKSKIPENVPRVRIRGQIYQPKTLRSGWGGVGYLVDGYDCIRLTLVNDHVDVMTLAVFEDVEDGAYVTVEGVVYRIPQSKGVKLLILKMEERDHELQR